MSAPTGRLRFLSVILLVASLVLICRLYLVQIVSGDSLKEKAEHQYVAGASYFNRGTIFFTTKDGTLVPGATVESGFTLVINPSTLAKTQNLESIYQAIHNIVPIDRETFMTRAGRTSRVYEEVGKELKSEEAEAVQKLSIPGVSVVRERWRTYPGGEIASHAIGLVGYQGDEYSGRYGLERQYEGILGRTGNEAFVNFFAEIFSNIQRSVSTDEELAGDIVTTIEPSVQTYLEGELDKITSKYSSEFTGGIVIDPKTGEIYAMGLTPDFDPNDPGKEASSAIFRNKFVEDRYEMGSIIKSLTIAAGLDSGAITAGSTFNDPGCMTLNTKTFCNYDGKSHGTSVTMQTVLNKSLNTGAAWAVQQMGNQTFSDYFLKFGLDETTGIDLPNEGKSLVSNLKSSRDLEYAQASFGQGIALTPIVTVRALSALANGGTLITPHLVKEIRYQLGTSKSISYPSEDKRPRAISAETSEEISRMMTEAVDRSLRNGQVRLENYSVAAKTGTAQIAKEGGGGYYADRYLHSFFGFFPSYDPEFLIFLYTYDPKGVQYASETLTDTFINTVKFLVNYYEIPPDRASPPPERG